MATEPTKPVVSTNPGKKVIKVVAEFQVPVSTISTVLGGKQPKGQFTREESYGKFYLKAALARLNGRIISEG